jgi:hypothetical protein
MIEGAPDAPRAQLLARATALTPWSGESRLDPGGMKLHHPHAVLHQTLH